MKIVDEPAEQVEAQLGARDVEVRREPYDPRSRNLVSDFVGFLREPRPGATVTLFEDDRGRVRYYTVTRPDPEVAALREQVAELSRPDAEAPPAVALSRMQKRLDALQEKVDRVDELAAQVERLPELEARVEELPELRAKVEQLPDLEARVAKLPELEAKVAKLPALESRLGEITQLRARLERLER